MDKGDFFVYKGPNRGVVLMTSIQDSFRLGFVPDGYTRCIEVKNGENYGPYTFRFGTIAGVSKGIRFHTAVNKFCLNASINSSRGFDQIPLKER